MTHSQFLFLADALPEALILVSAEAEVLAANRTAGRILKRTSGALVGCSLLELVENSSDQIMRHLRAWSRSRTPVPAPLRWRAAGDDLSGWHCQGFLLQPPVDGKQASIIIRCMPERASASEFVALNRELAKQQNALRRLQESRQKLIAEHEKAVVTLKSIGDAVITTDRKGRIEYLNPIAEQLTGWSTSEAEGRDLLDVFKIINEHSREPAVDPVGRCLGEGRIVGLANHTALIARDGSEYIIEDSAAPIHDTQDRILGAVLVFRDATENRLVQRQLTYLAQHDTLTGLFNRHYFEQELDRVVQIASRGRVNYAMLFIDLDRFKLVNDTAGHAVGDNLLRETAHLFSRRVRHSDLLARLGGDEFAVLLSNVSRDHATEVAAGFSHALGDLRFSYQGVDYDVNASIGIAMIDGGVNSAADVLRHADIACYEAKRRKRGRFHIYSEQDDLDLAVLEDVQLVGDIRQALASDRFRLFYQPIVSTAGTATGFYEVLMRMLGRDDELVLPGTLIRAAERNGIMTEIDRWVVAHAIDHLGSLCAADRVVHFSINLSGDSLGDGELLELIKARIEAAKVPPEFLTFEITETAAVAMSHIEQASAFVRELKALGCRFALDDFGTGFCSFAYLKFLPVDYIKIDGTFVRDILSDPVDQAMVRSINQIAHSLGMHTVAEFVENAEVLNELVVFGVDYAQGYHLGAPQPWQDVAIKAEPQNI